MDLTKMIVRNLVLKKIFLINSVQDQYIHLIIITMIILITIIITIVVK